MSKNTKSTSSKVAALASETLTNPNSSDIAKKLAGSALSQTNTGNQTGKEMETTASKVLQSDKYSEQTKELAASILSQSNKNR
jgi:hypothetical protein